MTIFGGCYMTKSEYMALPTAKEMMQALQRDPVLQNVDEACAAFNRRAQEEFEEKIKRSYGKYDPDIHYDFNRKETLNTQSTMQNSTVLFSCKNLGEPHERERLYRPRSADGVRLHQ